MAGTNYDMIKDIPGYKFILKAVLKTQIQLLVEQLATHTDEESVILTASVADGTLSHLGSDSGKSFLTDNEDLKASFMRYCMEKYETGSEYYDPDYPESAGHNGKTAEKPLGKYRHEPYPVSRLIHRRGSSASISSNGSHLSGFCHYGNKTSAHSLPDNYSTESQLENFNPPEEIKTETFLTQCDYPYKSEPIVKQTDTSSGQEEGDDASLSGRRSTGAVSTSSTFEHPELHSNQSVGQGSETQNVDYCVDDVVDHPYNETMGEEEDIGDELPDLDQHTCDPIDPEAGNERPESDTEDFRASEERETPPLLRPEGQVEGGDDVEDGVASDNLIEKNIYAVRQVNADKSESEQDIDRKIVETEGKVDETNVVDRSDHSDNRNKLGNTCSDPDMGSSDEKDKCLDEFGPCERPKEFHEKMSAINGRAMETSTTESKNDLAESERMEEGMTEDEDTDVGDVESQQHRSDSSELAATSREAESDSAKTEDSEGVTDIDLQLDKVNKELDKDDSKENESDKEKDYKQREAIVEKSKSEEKDSEGGRCSASTCSDSDKFKDPIVEALQLLTGWKKSKGLSNKLSKEMLYGLFKEKMKETEDNKNCVDNVIEENEVAPPPKKTLGKGKGRGKVGNSGTKSEKQSSDSEASESSVEHSSEAKTDSSDTSNSEEVARKTWKSKRGKSKQKVSDTCIRPNTRSKQGTRNLGVSESEDLETRSRNGINVDPPEENIKAATKDSDKGEVIKETESENNNDSCVNERGKSAESDKDTISGKSMLSENEENYQAREVQEECNDEANDDENDDVESDKRERRNSGVQTESECTKADMENVSMQQNTGEQSVIEKVNENRSTTHTLPVSETRECSTDTDDMNMNNPSMEVVPTKDITSGQTTQTATVTNTQKQDNNTSASSNMNPKTVQQSEKKVPSPIVIDLDESESLKVQKTPVKQMAGTPGQQRSGQKQQTPSSQTKRRLSTPESGDKNKSASKGSFIDNLISRGIPIIIPDDEEPVTPQKGRPMQQKSRSANYPNLEAMQSPYKQQIQHLSSQKQRQSPGQARQSGKNTQQIRMRQALAYYDQQVVNDYYESQGRNDGYDEYPCPQGYMASPPAQMLSPSQKAPTASQRQLFTPPKAVKPNVQSRSLVSPSHVGPVRSQSPSQAQRSMMDQIRSRSLAQHQESLNTSGQNRGSRMSQPESGTQQSRQGARNSAGLALTMPDTGQSPSGGKSRQSITTPGGSTQDLAAMQQGYSPNGMTQNTQESSRRPVASPVRQQLAKKLVAGPPTPQSSKSNIKSGMTIVIDDEPPQKPKPPPPSQATTSSNNNVPKTVTAVPKTTTTFVSVAQTPNVANSLLTTSVTGPGRSLNVTQNPTFVQATNMMHNTSTLQLQNLVQSQPLMQNAAYMQAPNLVQTSGGIIQNPGLMQNPNMLQSTSFVQNPMLIQNTGLVQNPDFLQNAGLVQNQRLVTLQQPTLTQIPVSSTLASPMHSPEILPVISNVTSMSKDYREPQPDVGSMLQLQMQNPCLQQVPASLSCVQDPNMGTQTYQTFVIQAQQLMPENQPQAAEAAPPERQTIEMAGVKRPQTEVFQQETIKTEPQTKRSRNVDSEIPAGYTSMDADSNVQNVTTASTATVIVKTEAVSPSKQAPGLELDIDLPGVPVLPVPSSEITKLRQQSIESKSIKEEIMEQKSSGRKKTVRKSNGGNASASYDDSASTSADKSLSDKKFGCGDCGKAFETKQGLSMHFKIHTKSKPLECDVCGKHYSKMGLLKKHIRTHFEDP